MAYDHEPWFAGNLSRDAAARVLEPLCDGSFLIRTSQSRVGSFTLTVKYVETRHIMIIQDMGRFGFSLPTNFASLQEMIHHFGRTSLACYNAELETTLAHPYKTAPAASSSQAFDEGPEEDIYMSNVSALRSNLARQGRVFQASLEERQEYSDAHQLRVKAKQTELKAQHEIQRLLSSQVQLHLNYQKGMSDKDRSKVLENFELLQSRVSEADALERTLASQIESLHQDMERRNTVSASEKPVLPPRSRAPSGAAAMGRRQSSASQMPSSIPNPDTSPFYSGLIDRDVALALLEPCPDGTFMIRKSDRPVDPYTLSLRYEGNTRHIKVSTDGVMFGLADQLVFHSLETLCDYYMETPISATIATTLRIPYKSVAR